MIILVSIRCFIFLQLGAIVVFIASAASSTIGAVFSSYRHKRLITLLTDQFCCFIDSLPIAFSFIFAHNKSLK